MNEIYYWDACVFLSYINGTVGRFSVIEDFLSRSRRGEFRIVTSTLSIVEVAFAAVEKESAILVPTVQARIDNLWADRKAIRLSEMHQIVAHEARRLVRYATVNGWALKPADAIHLATAIGLKSTIGLTEIHTYEPKWRKFQPEVGVRIRAPLPDQGVLDLPAVITTPDLCP